MREPSLHIKESDLVLLLQGVFKDSPAFKWDCQEMAKALVEKGKSYSANSRSIAVSNDKVDKKVNKLKLAGRSNTSAFAQILLHLRRQMKHRGLSLIKVGDKDWLDLKEACKLATDFCNEAGISLKEGYKIYLSIGMQKMQNFSIFKFKNLHSAICNHYDSMQEIEADRTPLETKDCHDYYLKIISEKVGYSQGFENNPDKYKYFVRTKNEANKLKVGFKIYLKSQFDAMDWHGGIPDPAQLVGEKAIIRLQKYLFQEGIKIGESKSGTVDFKKIRNAKRKG